jgi:hypothetical protein
VWADLATRVSYDRFARSGEPIVFGHEFCGAARSEQRRRRAHDLSGYAVAGVAAPLVAST